MIGGGIVGLACALELSRLGDRVVVLDAGPSRRKATLAAAGLLAPLSHKMASPRLTLACVEARDLWDEWHEAIVEASGQEVEYDTSGTLIAASTTVQSAVVKEVREAAEELGEPVSNMTAEELRTLVPDLPRRLLAGLLLSGEKRVDNVAFLAALTTAVERAGVEIVRPVIARSVASSRNGVEITTDDGRLSAGRAVLAAGSWAGAVEGCSPLPVRPVRGQMIRVGGAGWPWAGMVRVGDYYAVRRGPADVLFGATVEEAGFADHTTPAAIGELVTAFAEAFPGLADKPLVDSWSGLRPASADALPVVGAWRDHALFIAAGHHRDGVLLAPWTAARVAEWAASPATWEEDPSFSPGRFDDDRRRAPHV